MHAARIASRSNRAAPVLDASQYPLRWSDYVGQADAKRMLQVAARSARVRKQPLEHTLIAHPSPGIGKTSLAVMVANEMRTTVRVLSGPTSRDKARLVLAGMKDRDVLFWDEAHQMMDRGKKDAEWLLTFLQDGYIAGPLGPEEQPKVTLIAATTDAGKIPDSIVSRFPLVPTMEEYTTEEAAKIAQIMAKSVLEGLPSLGKKEAEAIATAASNNPRAIRRMLIVLRDLTITDELPLVKGRHYDIASLLAFQNITPDGLDPMAQKYLLVLAGEFGGSAGARSLEDRLQQTGGLGTVERVLMNKGFIAKTRAGRTLTQAGIHRYQELEEAS